MSFQRIVLAGALLAVFPVFPMFGQCMNPYVTVSLTTHADETQWVRITAIAQACTGALTAFRVTFPT